MARFQAFAERLHWLIFGDRGPHAAGQNRPEAARMAVPYVFNPNLSLGNALIAIVASLARIFGACVLFALWGGATALAWSAIGNHFWRVAAMLPMVLLFVAGLASLLIGISLLERRVAPKH